MAKRFIGGASTDVAPAGSVQAFAGTTAPYGWILCQGQELNIADFPALYAAIGTTWNTATNPTSGSAYSAPAAGKFRLPDFRGSFLRGAGNPSVGDACSVGGFQADKTAKNGLANSNSTATVNKNLWNSNQISHAHGPGGSTTYFITDGIGGPSANLTVGSDAYIINSSTASSTATWNSANATGTANAQTITGDSETRPLNQGVQYIIKY